MNTTSISLLERLRLPEKKEAWDKFVELYTPVLLSLAKRTGLSDQDAADLVQDVFTILVQKLPHFTYDPAKHFRNWLQTVLRNKWKENYRRRDVIANAAQGDFPNLPDPEVETAFWEREYRQHLVNRALELMQSEFETTTWKAFWESTANGRSAKEVARLLGMTPGAVYMAKSRVLARLRQELDGLTD